jgi:phosphatidylserine decarboxylase
MAPEGLASIAFTCIIACILTTATLFIHYSGLTWVLFSLCFLMVAFTAYFFRDPNRKVPFPENLHDSLVLAPADGKIVVIAEVDEPLYIGGRARQISIFLSPLDVHVNRIPVQGKVEFVQYVKGAYLVAWEPKASERNERSEIGVLHSSGRKFVFKQIAGFVARRIVYYTKKDEQVKLGERFGIVKFGSRMDVIMPLDVEVTVELGQKVHGGLTLLGKIN